jgi:cytochrome-b5 reductase
MLKIVINNFFSGIFELKLDHKSPPVVKRIKHIGMIAGGTGITPMFQLIKDICYHKEDKTKLSLVFCNKTEEDILLHEELDTLASENPGQFDVWYTVTQSDRPGKLQFICSWLDSSKILGI